MQEAKFSELKEPNLKMRYVVGALVNHLRIAISDELESREDHSIGQILFVLNFSRHFTNVDFWSADNFPVYQSISEEKFGFNLQISNFKYVPY